jgi:hypothetical protein
VFSVLVVIFCCDRVAGTARIAGKLDIFLGNVRGGAADLDVGSVGFENPGHRVLAAPVVIVVTTIIIIIIVVPTAHTLVVVRTVSHVVPFTDSE